jgi:putative transposase
VCHHDNGSQYLSFAFTRRLVEVGVDASVGSFGDALDNALAESTIGLRVRGARRCEARPLRNG